MKTYFILLFFIVAIFVACNKKPTANFTTDKTTYAAGETIHCTDISDNAYSWKWNAPNGQIYTTQNLDFVTDSNDAGGTKTFLLEVESKKGNIKNQTSKSITLKEGILSTDFFGVANGATKPDKKTCGSSNYGWWSINASNGMNNGFGLSLQIYFPGTNQPSIGSYSTISTTPNNLPSGSAKILITNYHGPDAIPQSDSYYSYSGNITVSQTNSGKTRVVFNNVSARHDNDTINTYFISGDITCH